MMRFGLLVGSVILGLGFAGCSTPSPKQETVSAVVAPSEDSGANHAAVTPGAQTHVLNFHVEFANFSPEMKGVAQKALTRLEGKCWIHKAVEAPETPGSSDPHYCVKFDAFTGVDQLKPYKRIATDKKMLVTGLAEQGSLRIQNYVWDGKKVQRVRNSDSLIQITEKTEVGFANFMMGWALK